MGGRDMADARTRKRRTCARVLHRARHIAALNGSRDDWDDDDWPEDEPDDLCLHCHGDGMDPDCDYLLPCPDCGGPF